MFVLFYIHAKRFVNFHRGISLKIQIHFLLLHNLQYYCYQYINQNLNCSWIIYKPHIMDYLLIKRSCSLARSKKLEATYVKMIVRSLIKYPRAHDYNNINMIDQEWCLAYYAFWIPQYCSNIASKWNNCTIHTSFNRWMSICHEWIIIGFWISW